MAYFYDSQIRRFLLQITRMFSHFEVEYKLDDNGNPITIRVPVRYGDASKQASVILQENSANNVPCAPLISFYITDLEYDRPRMQEPYYVDRKYIREREYDETSGTYGNKQGNAFTVERPMPVPYNMSINVDFWTTNTHMKLQLIEQVATLFNPSLEIQSTDNYLDWTSLSTVELKRTKFSSRSIPNGSDDIDIFTYSFDIPIWIAPPARVTKEGVIHKIIANIYDDAGEFVQAISGDDILNGTRVTVTPHGYQILLIGNQLQILRPSNPSTAQNATLDAVGLQDTTIAWKPTIDEYGVLRNGITQIRLQSNTASDIVGTVAYHPTNEDILLFTIDPDTLPANTQSPIDAVINPLNSGPAPAGTEGMLAPAVVGQRYLLTEGTGDLTDTSLAASWAGTIELVANSNDIIEYDGANWVVVFDSINATDLQYVTNITTSLQYKWDGEGWVKSFEGIYNGGDWSLTL